MIKKAYFYLFYKIYMFADWAHTVFPHDMAAAAAISMLEILFIGSLKFYYIGYIDPKSEPTLLEMILAGTVVVLINTIAFIFSDKWKIYFKEFDALPRYKNKIGTWIVIIIVAFVLINMVISIKVMGAMAGRVGMRSRL